MHREVHGAAPRRRRQLQHELTYDGLRAAEAKGNKRGRRPAVPADKTQSMCTAYLEGRTIAALSRDHAVSRGAIPTAADLFCGRCGFEGLLLGGRLCERCTLSNRLTALLDDGTGRIHPQLVPLHEFLGESGPSEEQADLAPQPASPGPGRSA